MLAHAVLCRYRYKASCFFQASLPLGKSSFGQYLAREHGFAHYDMEHHPDGWPHPELEPIWDSSGRLFVAELKILHPRIVLDWGFHPANEFRVHELLEAEARLVWFAADIEQSRNLFVQRGDIPVARFDAQVRAIRGAGYPNTLRCLTVEGLTLAGQPRDSSEICREVFAA